MKKKANFSSYIILLILIFGGSLNTFGTNPTYSCEIRNGSFINAQTFEFDIYLTQTGASQLELAGFNTGILLNTGFVNGGIITPSFLSGSELTSSQVPQHIAYDASYRCVKIAPRTPPRDYTTGLSSGTIISNTTGTKVCRVRLENSTSFGTDPMNYTWSMSLMPYHTVVAAFIPGNTHPVNIAVTSNSSHSKSENLFLYLEGLYATGIGNHKAQDENGDHYPGPVADNISVKLAEASFPYSPVFSDDNVPLYSNGKCSISIPGSLTESYYIVIHHRNSLETWSSAPVSFTSGIINYDFSTAATQAFGNNLKSIGGGIFAIFGGDVSQDGVIDGSDMASVDNASTAIIHGYFPSDVNGDGVVDGSDMALVDNNSTSVVTLIKP
ncbi:MAG: hypothetical protein HXX13_02125 [Bacteroidetes bacterium]|nr:hypothetical protein [Bacteroidota bacterium]